MYCQLVNGWSADMRIVVQLAHLPLVVNQLIAKPVVVRCLRLPSNGIVHGYWQGYMHVHVPNIFRSCIH